MMYASSTMRFRSVPMREFLTFALKASIIVVVVVLFDLFSNWSTGIFAALAIMELLDEYLGLRYLRIFPQQETIQETLVQMLIRIRQVVMVTRIAYIIAWITVVLLLGLNVTLGSFNVIRWALILLPLAAALIWWSSRRWKSKLNEVNTLLESYERSPMVA